MAQYSAEKGVGPQPDPGFSKQSVFYPEENLPPITDVMTGDTGRDRQLLFQLIACMRRAQRIDFIVSFLMESGVKELISGLEEAADRGVRIRILTGNYLGITQPSALYLLKQRLGDKVDLRFYNDKNRSFHAKSYIFHYESYSDIFIGSSNVSQSALTSGIEWNYCFSSRTDPENYQKFYDTFENLFEHHSILIDDKVLHDYSKHWHQPSVQKDLDRYESREDTDNKIQPLYQPRGAQIEALCALENCRAEGANKGLVQAATGVGKTYLAAFDSREFRSVLYVAHRREILDQAAQSFRNVRKSDDFGFFDGNDKCHDRSVIFASVATLGRSEYLNEKYFSRDQFDYVVIDEFHHAVTAQYRRIVEYFQPQFLLGLTATPDRMDGKNIYELCDYNVPYELSLKDAINKGMLVPFRYYGIYDDTDYSRIHRVRGKYDEKELNETYIGNVHRHDLIFKNYMKYGSERALGFCCSRVHAEEMAGEFSRRGIPSVAVYSDAAGEYSMDREEAVRKLKSGEIRVIFSVDMFNEGVDIPDVDMVMFLRPTESPIVFLQQLGRGLRKSKGKEYLIVLDFIGNYEKAGNVRALLTGESVNSNTRSSSGGKEPGRNSFPDGCQVDFDLQLIDLFSEMDRKHLRVKDQIRDEYYRVEEQLGHRPSRLELFTYMDDEVYALCVNHSQDNIFKNYLEFLHETGRLMSDELNLYEGIGREFLHLLETTSMTKVYKMPVLNTFYNKGNIRMAVTEEELLISWKEFFGKGMNWKDLKTNITWSDYQKISDKDHLKNIMQNPVNFLLKSGRGFFVSKEGYALALNENLEEVVKDPAFSRHMGDIIKYRTMDYYQRRYHNRDM